MKIAKKVVVHLTAASEKAAGKVTYDMHQLLLHAGVESWIITPKPGPKQENVIRLHATSWGYKFYHIKRLAFVRLKGRRPERMERNPDYHFNIYAEEQYYSAEYILKKVDFEIDAFIIHFYDSFLNTATITRLGQLTGARIMWLMMDMAPITGGCHYSWGCQKYRNSCGKCPALNSDEEDDRSRQQLNCKTDHLAGSSVEVIAASGWQLNQVMKSRAFSNRRIHSLIIPVNENTFKPMDKRESKILHGISPEKRVILFGAAFIHEKRKGFRHLLDALKYLHERYYETKIFRNWNLLVIGAAENPITVGLGINVIYKGVVRQEELPSIYNASDIYVCSSIEDSGPTMLNQAMMSGVPCVAYEMGVALDLVTTSVSGIRVPLNDYRKLGEALYELMCLNTEQYSKMSVECRKKALRIGSNQVFLESMERIIS